MYDTRIPAPLVGVLVLNAPLVDIRKPSKAVIDAPVEYDIPSQFKELKNYHEPISRNKVRSA